MTDSVSSSTTVVPSPNLSGANTTTGSGSTAAGSLSDGSSGTSSVGTKITSVVSTRRIDDPVLMNLLETGRLADMLQGLLELMRGINKVDKKNANAGIDFNQKLEQENFKKMMDRMNQAEQARREAREQEKTSNILSIIMKVAAVVGAALGVVAAGASAPLLVISIAALAYTATNMAMQSAGKQSIDLVSHFNEFSEKLLEGCGVSKDNARKFAPALTLGMVIGMSAAAAGGASTLETASPKLAELSSSVGMALLIQNASAVGNFGAMVADCSGADSTTQAAISATLTLLTALVAAKGLANATSRYGAAAHDAGSLSMEVAKAQKFANWIALVANAGSSSIGAGKAGVDIEIAQATFDASNDKADADFNKGMKEQFEHALQEAIDFLASLYENAAKNQQAMSKMLSDLSKPNDKIIGNLA